jgi:hypothetical protein
MYQTKEPNLYIQRLLVQASEGIVAYSELHPRKASAFQYYATSHPGDRCTYCTLTG